ncbi:uncharacterized protein LOC144921399 isoform X2 [Branchiostoma floridae x Branchiostoma belcheri]
MMVAFRASMALWRAVKVEPPQGTGTRMRAHKELLSDLCLTAKSVIIADELMPGLLKKTKVRAWLWAIPSQQPAEAREQFKDFVNNVAVIRQEEGEKFLVLKKKYREPTAQVSRVRPLAVEELEYTGEEPQNNIPYQPPDQPSSYLAFQEPPLPPPPALASPVRRDWDVPAPPAEHEAGWQPPYQQPDLVRRQPSFNDYNQQQPYDEPEIIRRQPSFNQPPSPYERNDEPLPVNRQSSFKEPVSVARKPSFEKAITHNQFPPHEPPPSPLDDTHSPTFKRPSPPAQSQNGGPKSELQLPRSDSSSRMETGSSRSDTVSIRSDTASISEKKRVHFAEYDEYLILHQDFVPSSQLYYHHTHRPQLMLDVLEKEWMLKAAVGNVSALRRLLSQDPNLASKKDFVSGVSQNKQDHTFCVVYNYPYHGKTSKLEEACFYSLGLAPHYCSRHSGGEITFSFRRLVSTQAIYL